MRRWSQVAIWIAIGVLLAGCPKGKDDYKAGIRSEDLKDYDAAVDYYLKATQSDPHNANFKIRLDQARFEAGEQHIRQGIKLRDKGDLQGAVSEFQRAQVMDPSSMIADQELKRTIDLIAEKNRATQNAEEPLFENGQPVMASNPPELKPLSRAPINLKMSNDSKVVFDTIGKLALQKADAVKQIKDFTNGCQKGVIAPDRIIGLADSFSRGVLQALPQVSNSP